jgi:hypothetical protein
MFQIFDFDKDGKVTPKDIQTALECEEFKFIPSLQHELKL